MAKVKTEYVCASCGAVYPRWLGQCRECGEWNTISEQIVEKAASVGRAAASRAMDGFAGISGTGISNLKEISIETKSRLSTGYREFDRVLGGGIVRGSVVLIGGNPGAGKSTLLLQTVCRLASLHKVLYITGEESLEQVALWT